MTSVALLVDQLFSPAPGGIGTYVRQLVPALSRAEPSLGITLFHSRFDTELPEPWMKAYPIEQLPHGIRRLYPQWSATRRPKLPETLAANDIVHSPSPAAVPPAKAPQRLVVTVHDLAFVVHPALFPPQWRLMYRAALARAVRTADAIVTVSRHTAEDLLRHTRVDRTKIHVTPLAASLPQTHKPVEDVLERLKVRQPYVLYSGTLEPRKNLVRLVRAYRRMASRGAPHVLVLAGPMGWRPQALMAELAAEGPGSIVLTGSTPAEDLDALYRGAAVFAYPSLYEGFGLPVLEAMARGAPCVVSTASSLPEVAGEAAVPVDPQSVGAMAEALERVANDRALAERLSAAGVERAKLFSWDETARKTLDVYKSLA